MTNGEKLKEVFPDIEIIREVEDVYVIMLETHNVCSPKLEVFKNWWNTEYKEPSIQERQAESDKFDAAFQDGYNDGYAQAKFDYEQEPPTKNDLGVELISKADALDCVNWGYSFSDIYKKISDLPLVTPIRPKGHWIKTELPARDAHECSECGGLALVDEDGNEQLTDYCPNCSADMSEVENGSN